MQYLQYLAYGSNLHPLRLSQRCPSAQLLGAVKLKGFALRFHKRGSDGSGKCNLVDVKQGIAYGALFSLCASEKSLLDKIEGLGRGYTEQSCAVQLNGSTRHAFYYRAQSEHIDPLLPPFDWYKQLVLAGARFHQMPASYITTIEATESIPDPDGARHSLHKELVEQMASLRNSSSQ